MTDLTDSRMLFLIRLRQFVIDIERKGLQELRGLEDGYQSYEDAIENLRTYVKSRVDEL